MNEILKKRIEEAADKHSFKYLSQDRIEELELGCHYEAGFIAGAEYAISHQWISVEDVLPKYDEAVLVIDKTGIEGTGVYFNHRSSNPMVKTYENGFCDIGMSEVMYWCEVPKFETKENEL